MRCCRHSRNLRSALAMPFSVPDTPVSSAARPVMLKLATPRCRASRTPVAKAPLPATVEPSCNAVKILGVNGTSLLLAAIAPAMPQQIARNYNRSTHASKWKVATTHWLATARLATVQHCRQRHVSASLAAGCSESPMCTVKNSRRADGVNRT